jgi:uncharacterized protein YbjT (DUF2867 family)
MDVVVAGGHGQIARRLLRLLARSNHSGRGLIRNPAHAADLERDGAEPIVCDLETDADVRPHLRGADALVFAAGAGPGSGAARKRTMDLGGALKCIEAARDAGVERFLMVSAMAPAQIAPDDPMRPYWEAKIEADEALRASDLAWTIVRPGRLTNEPGTGLVDIAPDLGRRGSVPRDDVALVLYHCLTLPAAIGVGFDLLEGRHSVESALRSLTPR